MLQIVSAISLCFVVTVACQAESPLDERAVAAEIELTKSLEDADTDLINGLKTKLEAAQQRGDLTAYEQIKTEIRLFEEEGQFPKSLRSRSWETKRKSAYRRWEILLQNLVIELTKEGKIEEAKAVQETLKRRLKGNNHPDDAIRFRSSHYKVFKETVTWGAAHEACEKMGGKLVVIRSTEENAFITRLARNAGLPAVWLGITCLEDNRVGKWKTPDRQPLKFTNWDSAKGQPNYAQNVEFYGVLLVARDGLWWDYPFDARAYPGLTRQGLPGYICRWD